MWDLGYSLERMKLPVPCHPFDGRVLQITYPWILVRECRNSPFTRFDLLTVGVESVPGATRAPRLDRWKRWPSTRSITTNYTAAARTTG